jgi:hypothetical protein
VAHATACIAVNTGSIPVPSSKCDLESNDSDVSPSATLLARFHPNAVPMCQPSHSRLTPRKAQVSIRCEDSDEGVAKRLVVVRLGSASR